MRWRLLKLDLPYLVGELFIVILGVSIALAAEQWRQENLENELASQYLERLIQDIEFEVQSRNGLIRSTEVKNNSLEASLAWIGNPDMSENAVSTLLDNLTNGAQRAFGAGIQGRRTTFDDLVSTGNLGLIDDLEHLDIHEQVGKTYEKKILAFIEKSIQ